MRAEALQMVGSRLPRDVKDKLVSLAKSRGTTLSQLVSQVLTVAADGGGSSRPSGEEPRSAEPKHLAFLEALVREIRSARTELAGARGDIETLAGAFRSEREYAHAAHADMYEALLLVAAEARSGRFTPDEARAVVNRCFRNRARSV